MPVQPLNSGQFVEGNTPWNKGKKCPEMSGDKNGFYGRKHTDETKLKMSEAKKSLFANDPDRQRGMNNNMYGRTHSEETKSLLSKMLNERDVNPIVHVKRVSFPQIQLYNLLICTKYPTARLEFPVKTENGTRYLDIAIPEIKLNVEYDGEPWHQDKAKDERRDAELRKVGWKVIRVDKIELRRLIQFHGIH